MKLALIAMLLVLTLPVFAETTTACDSEALIIKGPSLPFEFVREEQGQSREKVNPLMVPGEILSIRLTDAHLSPVFVAENLSFAVDKYVAEMVEVWKRGVFAGNDALHYANLETVAAIRKVQSQTEFEGLMARHFLELSKIEDTSSGLYVERDEKPARYGVEFRLARDSNELQLIDISALPPSIYGLQIWTRANGKRELHKYFLVVRSRE